ncbi:MAG: DUF2281 domain-containing protein [Microcoleus sp.]|uniref:DUF2281 domain-containing protein n=1 Tax=Microcoleus sp. TaxID=44472 RepID=UPI003C70CA8F
MQNAANIEQLILEKLRYLPPEKQQEVLDFTEFLWQKSSEKITISKLSLRQIAALPLEERHQILARSIPATADDFITDPELTEFSILDTEEWMQND